MEFYIKTVGDPNYQPNEIQIENEVEQVITQIEVILFTNKGDVMGYPDFGCSLEDLIYELSYNEYQIKEEINNQIARYCPLSNKYNLSVNVEFVNGTIRNAALIDITINTKYYVQVYVD